MSAALGVSSRAEERRRAATGVVVACYRLTRSLQLHASENHAVQEAVPPLCEAIRAFCGLHSVEHARLLFTRDLVFVNRRIVRAPRDTYALALQVGGLLEHVGQNELGFEARVEPAALLRVMRALVDAQRDPVAAARLLETSWAGVTLRKAQDPTAELADVTSESPLARLVKTYASSILVLRSFHEEARGGGVRRAHEVKRIAQKLVALSEEQPELLVAMAAARFVDADLARRALSTAVVAVAMLRELAPERGALGVLALAALTTDLGALRLSVGAEPARLPASALLVATLAGGLQEVALQRAVVTYEALGGSVDVTLLASILRVARRWNDLRAPRPDAKGLAVGAAVSALEADARTELDWALVRLLVSALGFYPLRTIVELDTGEVAVVTGAPAMALDFARPPVQILTDAAQALRAKPLDLDLARPPHGEKPRRVVRPLTLAKS